MPINSPCPWQRIRGIVCESLGIELAEPWCTEMDHQCTAPLVADGTEDPKNCDILGSFAE